MAGVASMNNPIIPLSDPREIAATFEALLSTADFTQELRMFKVGRFNRSLRKTLLNEFEGTYIGLWALALEQSFPKDAQIIFDTFLQKYLEKFAAKRRSSMSAKIKAYRDMVLSTGGKDFSQLSRHLLSFAKIEDSALKAETLRLSLVLRNHYSFIFQRLV